jgi:hypothetical protein
MERPALELYFPNLRDAGYVVTSMATPSYNCIAWAAGDDQRWWQPPIDFGHFYWPSEAPTTYVLSSFIQAFALYGYEPGANDNLEPRCEKVALYVDADGLPTHMARQLDSGMWTSKLGEWEDIEHNTLAALESEYYGTVAQILKRPREGTQG